MLCQTPNLRNQEKEQNEFRNLSQNIEMGRSSKSHLGDVATPKCKVNLKQEPYNELSRPQVRSVWADWMAVLISFSMCKRRGHSSHRHRRKSQKLTTLCRKNTAQDKRINIYQVFLVWRHVLNWRRKPWSLLPSSFSSSSSFIRAAEKGGRLFDFMGATPPSLHPPHTSVISSVFGWDRADIAPRHGPQWQKRWRRSRGWMSERSTPGQRPVNVMRF